MDMIKKITNVLLQEYAPQSMILYGSCADGSFDQDSDFDALLICDAPTCKKRSDMLEGVRLDVHFVSSDELILGVDPEEYLQVYDGVLLRDEHGTGAKLIESVRAYVAQQPFKTHEEKALELAWCDKMLVRAQRGDAEGFYRWHWLLTESLMIYCEIKEWFYFGPKKTIKRMQKEDEASYRMYEEALRKLDWEQAQTWIKRLHALL